VGTGPWSGGEERGVGFREGVHAHDDPHEVWGAGVVQQPTDVPAAPRVDDGPVGGPCGAVVPPVPRERLKSQWYEKYRVLHFIWSWEKL